jgi:hypothetical protein
MSDHDEHLEWCKQRAREYLDQGDAINAIASMHSDLNKHPDWQKGNLLAAMTLLFAVDSSLENARRIIEGYR